MKLRKANQGDIAGVAAFLARLNGQALHQVGYCGFQEEDIAGDIEGFITNFFLAESQEGITACLGFDPDGERVWVWGPWADIGSWSHIPALWRMLEDSLPPNTKKEFFFSLENSYAREFVRSLGGRETSQEQVWLFARVALPDLPEASCQPITPQYFPVFRELHSQVFPGAYYSGEEILAQGHPPNLLLGTVREGRLAGYIFLTCQPQFGEGAVEFFAVAPEFRGLGLAKTLLAAGLREALTDARIKRVQLCVRGDNSRALGLYQSLGFKKQHDLLAMRLEKQGCL